MLRSPSSSHSSLAEAPKSSSVPDISQLQDDGKIIKTRKRKQPEPESEMAGTLKTFMESMSVSMEAMNKSINEVIKVELKNLSATTSDIKNELNLLRSENAEIKNKLAAMDAKQCETSSVLSDMQNSLEFTSDRVDKLHKRVDSAESHIKHEQHIQLDVSELQQKLKGMQLELEKNQQRDRMFNLEISGLPEHKTENLENILINVAKYANVPLTVSDIEHVNRVQPRAAFKFLSHGPPSSLFEYK
ncbi:hypothetical protein JYU34_007372 [Plutella xylostella]|uniref:Uncharacterized protein n=1 Tax=Plutella xylostella TaxID=51655 RepID=A0ABQ7QQC0_PLUXY|nr:hypothetical protein JYU34_007372 [Plutella xylostella]